MPFITKLGSVAARAYGWLAAVAQAVVSSDTYFYLVSMLLPGNGTNGATNNTFLDSSTNNFTVTRNGNTTQGTFTPFSQTGWSNYFDGSGDYLSVPDSAAFAFGTGDFTIECWLNPASAGVARRFYSQWVSPGDSQIFLRQDTVTSGTLRFSVALNTVTLLTLVSTGTLPVNTWSHVALVRSGNTFTWYINGVSSGTATAAITMPDLNANVLISTYDGTNEVYLGYISNMRVVKGTALYVSNFVPSNVPLTPISGTSLLTCQSNRFVDNSANNFTITRNGDVTVAANSPFAPNNITPTSYSGYFDGSGDYLSAGSNAAFAFGTGAYTIECWIYPTSLPAMVLTGVRATGGLQLFYDTTSGIGASSVGSPGFLFAGTIVAGQWYHVALVRSSTASNDTKIYINGRLGATGTDAANWTVTGPLIIGANQVGTEAFPGLISNVRWVKGTAVYTAAFTPPTSPLTAIANTSLLTCQNATFIDNSTNAFAITVSGNTQPVTTNPFQAPTPSPVSYSGQFDGTTGFLNTASSATFNFGTNNFTVEAWILPANVSGTKAITGIFQTGIGGWYFGLNNAALRFSSGVTDYDAGTVSAGVWTHVAATRSGNDLRMFINGVQVNTTTNISGQNFNFTNALRVGNINIGGWLFAGYISNVRVVNGTAVYTSNFVPPTSPLTAIANTAILTCQNNRFIDNSSNAFAITVNGDTRPVINSPFGYQTPISSTAYSGYFDGTGDYLTAPANAAFNMGGPSNNFTIECWVYQTANSGVRGVLGPRPSTGGGNDGGYGIYLDNGVATFQVWTFGAFAADTALGPTVPLNTWTHIAGVRFNSQIRVYVNGIGGTPVSATRTGDNSSPFYVGTYEGAVYPFTGLISNARAVKGTAVYTSNFTPPTSPLTAIANTSLLTCQNSTFIDNSTNAFTITANGNAATTSVNPFGYSFPAAPTPVSYSALTNGGSGYFDGSGDYLSAASNAAFNFGSGDFTVEAWINTATVAAGQGMIVGRQDAGGGAVFQFRRDAAVVSLVLRNSAGGGLITVATGNVLNTNVWTHVAVVRSGTSIVIYVNGVSSATGTSSTSPDPAGARPLTIGALDDGVLSSYFTGFISNLRIVKGTAVYTSAFTPPPAPVTAITNTSLLLNYTNAGIADAASQNDLETSGGMQITTAQAKWGGTSMLFPSTAGSYLVTNSVPNLALGSGDFTVEFWVYFATSAASKILVDWRPSGTDGVYPTIYTGAGSLLAFYTSSADRIVSGSAMSVNTWMHIALVRSSGTTKLYVNGTQVGSNYTDANNYLGTAGRPYIGGSSRTINDGLLNGYMNDFRITRYARYTANFTPPTAAFPTR